MASDDLRACTIDRFLDRLASGSPTPGGGSVAGLVAALAAALGRMVCAFTLGRPRFAAVEGEVSACDRELARLDALARELLEEDAAAYAALSAGFKLPKSDPQRRERLAAAAELAAVVPLAVAATSRQIDQLLARLAPLANPQLASDARVAGLLARTAIHAAAINVRVNLPLVSTDSAARIEAELDQLERHAAATD